MINRDEAVQKLSKVARISVAYAEDLYDSIVPKPVVPQYVADGYWANKDGLEFNLIDWINKLHLDVDGEEFTEFDEWLTDTDNNPIQTLVDMHRLGYEVEEEMKYTVTMKNVSYNGHPQFLCTGTRETFWSCGGGFRKTKYTRKELEENGFGWVFDCEGIEIEEVE